ncbi:MAG: alpha-galactosidase [Massiliimalia sp.]|jgi:alpha-galactosidase
MFTILRKPDYVLLHTQDNKINQPEILPIDGDQAQFHDVSVMWKLEDGQLKLYVTGGDTPIKLVRLRWNQEGFPEGTRFLSDEWERGYGAMEWRGMVPNRWMPWYFLASQGQVTAGYGVKVRPGAFCFWQADEEGITLWMDLRCGGKGVVLNGRCLEACQVVFAEYEGLSAFQAARKFCSVMCTDSILPKEPVYGSNNWYYAYGVSSHQEILGDADYLCELVGKEQKNRPFMVIDDGWQVNHSSTFNGGPWHTGNPDYPDMAGLTKEIEKRGCKPGIWIRLLLTSDTALPEHWRLENHPEILDPSVPEVIEYVKADIRRLTDWGYQLIKHDFSTFDLFGRWGFSMHPWVTHDGWSFADQSRTSAEIVVDLYAAILEAAQGKAYILGCNCIGHLGAGLMHLQRVGDDTSGLEWERTRRLGVNTLAFRLPQNHVFFDIDADCVGILDQNIPWELNSQWLDLVARSGSSLFVSAKPGQLDEGQKQQLNKAFAENAVQTHESEPLDWMDNMCPSRWKINGEVTKYHWYEKTGVSCMQPFDLD